MKCADLCVVCLQLSLSTVTEGRSRIDFLKTKEGSAPQLTPRTHNQRYGSKQENSDP